MTTLRTRLIRLAHQNPGEIRDRLTPILQGLTYHPRLVRCASILDHIAAGKTALLNRAAKYTPLSAAMRKRFELEGIIFVHEEDPYGDLDGIEVGRSATGGYVGATFDNSHWRWLARYGMYSPETGVPGATTTCNIARVTKGEFEGKWCGWSHRAAAMFGVGDMLFDESLLDESRPDYAKWGNTTFDKVGTIKITTDEQARQAAANFACHVG